MTMSWARRGLLLYVVFVVVVILPGTAIQAWQLVGQTFPGFLVQPTLQVSPYNSDPGAQQRDRIIRCEGEAVSRPDQLFAKAKAVGVGKVLHYDVLRQGRIVTIVQTVRTFTMADFIHGFVAMAGLGMIFLGVALFLLLSRTQNEPALMFAYACASLGSFLVMYFDFNLTHRFLWLSLLPYALVGGAFLAFAQVFPATEEGGGWFRRHGRLPLVLSSFGALALFGTWFGVSHDDPASVGHRLIFAQLVTYTLTTAIGVLSIIAFALARLRSQDPLARQQIGLLLFGATAAFMPFAVGWAIPESLWRWHLLPLDLTLQLFGIFPIFVAYGIVRHQLFDVQVIIKRSVTYLMVFTILIAAYYLLITAVSQMVLDAYGANLTVTLLLALAFQPLRDYVQRLIDRLFFRAAYDVQMAIETAAEELTKILDIDQVLAKLEATILRTMHPESAAILLSEPTTGTLVRARQTGRVLFPDLALDAPVVLEAEQGRQILSRVLLSTRKPHRVSGNLEALKAELLVPLFFEDRLIGVILLDQKKSAMSYNTTDIALLWTLARQAALAIENARRHGEIQQLNEQLEARIQERTQDLEMALLTLRKTQAQLLHNEKMASIGFLTAGMAHEINNPTTIVHGHLELIRDYIAEMEMVWQVYDMVDLTTDAMATVDMIKVRMNYDEHRIELPELISAAVDGNRRIRQIISDLRAFSSDMDRQEVPAEKLLKGLRATVDMVQGLFKGRIAIEAQFDTLPNCDIQANQINQVISNLLINAAQATPGEGIVRLSVSMAGDEVRLVVQDYGFGIPESARSKIFDPFFTTKPIGEGMGLGLAICYALVTANGGRIEVLSQQAAAHQASGTTFQVHLPIIRKYHPTPILIESAPDVG
ncbi:MAG: GAF domain-containing protein [Candidatus Sericytochromatia bacterium]|nr:GAF domain-containing protein [Candidatus Sericytochromatia bacterium]